MFDSRLRLIIDPPLKAAARALARIPYLSGNHLTAFGFVFALLCFAAISQGAFMLALGCIALNRLCDGLDGPVAREKAKETESASDLGGFYDIVADFIFYAGVPFFFAVHNPEHALAAAFLIFSFIASCVTFLGGAIIAEKRGITTQAQGKKSFYYLAGLMEGFETIIFLSLMCIIPHHFEVIAYIFGALCFVSAAMRVMLVAEQKL